MNENRAKILIVDDEEPVRQALSRKLSSMGYECTTAKNGKDALKKVFSQNFDLVLLDIMMPGISGMDVLSGIVSDHSDAAVIMITAVSDSQTAVRAMQMGAYDYVCKPFDFDELASKVLKSLEKRKSILDKKSNAINLERECEMQEGRIRQYIQEAVMALAREELALEKLSNSNRTGTSWDVTEEYFQLAGALAEIAELHEPYALGHSDRVALLANEIAVKLGYSPELIKDLRLAAIVHDIGKIVIPDHILLKPDHLTPSEYNEVKRHPTVAVGILNRFRFFKSAIPMVEGHHEWYNGRGYPKKLKGEDIPQGARILAVADAFDAMTSTRPHRANLSTEEAIEALKNGAGTQWDPVIVHVLVKILNRESDLLQTACYCNEA